MASGYTFVNNVLGHCRLCTQKDEAQDMVACDKCDRWFHYGCVNLPSLPKAKDPWTCAKCNVEEKECQEKALQMQSINQKLAEILVELEARAKAQKSAEVHASSMAAELAHYKEQLDNKNHEDKSKRDVLLDIAHVIQKNKLKTEVKVSKEKTGEEIEEGDAFTLYMRRQEMSLPQFFGNAKDWPIFKKMFEATTEQGKYSSLENLMRLQKALGGQAAKSVQPLMLDQSNVPRILERLEKQFGQSKRVYRELREDLEKVRAGGHLAIVEVANALEGLVAHLVASNQNEYLRDPRLVEEVIHKLPHDLQIKWMEVVESNVQKGNIMPTLQDLYNWIKPKADVQRDLYSQTRSQGERRNRVNVHQETSGGKCFLCNKEHRIKDCRQFLNMTPKERANQIFKYKACVMCLNKHRGTCWTPLRCDQGNCNGRHNKLLHFSKREFYPKQPNPPPQNNSAKIKVEEAEIKEERSNLHQEKASAVFYQIMPVMLRNGNRIIKTYAFLDPGSSLTLLDEGIAEELQLEGVPDPLRIKWTQNVSREEKGSKRVKLSIMGKSGEEFTLTNVRTAAHLHLPVQTVNYSNLQKDFPYLKNLPISDYKNAQPKLLIGLNHSHLLYPIEKRVMGKNKPIAIRTELGWLIFGNISDTVQENHVCMIQEDERMHEMMQRYFTTEDFGVKVIESLPESKQDIRAKELIEKTLNYTGERYEIGLLWKEDDYQFPDSYNQAYKRLLNLEAKLKKDSQLKEWVIDTIKDYVVKGYARKLSTEEVREWAKDVYFLPHFVVVNKNKSPPKPRLVFDAAAEVKGVSLNSALLSGPDATTSSFGMTTRFREGRFASAGDIKEMFSQVGIIKQDQKKQCFLFRDCQEDRKPDVYVMQVMIFGATCSPACAQVVKNYNAGLFSETKPEAAEAVVKQHYVDDYIDSFDSSEEAIKIIKDVIEIHNKASFFIRNFVSNDKSILAALPKDRVQASNVKTFEDKESTHEKVLGVYWNTAFDYIGYQLKFDRMHEDVKKGIRRPTKREILSFVMSIYDPMGLISNLTIHGKILMQELHKETSFWDYEISNHLFKQWEQWIEMLKQVTNMKIPRWIFSQHAKQFELHTFVDASEYAFAATIYVRGLNSLGQTASVRLLVAKARVAPIRKLSIPRLELQAAVLGARLTKTIQQELRKQPIKTSFWSDSQTVLSWIYSDHRKYSQFVAHRVGEILEITTMDQWHYVPTADNPADEGTKQAKTNSIWFKGPEFLWNSIWPTSKFERNTLEEIKNTVLVHYTDQEELKFIQDYRYSDWDKLVKHVCILKKFADWNQNKREFNKNITYEDKKIAEQAIIRKAQWEGLTQAMEDLSKNGDLTKQCDVSPLVPALNEYGVMISRSRLQNTNIIPLSARQPIILPYKHHITRLIMKMYHEKYLHQGDNVVLGAAYQKYWIMRSRQVLHQVKAACQKCKIRKACPILPQMAVLPKCRLSIYANPFTHTGVDYFGPLEVQVKRSTEKRWGVIFTCMTTRAVYIELAERLDTDAFIVCLRNFQHRRGKVKYLYSDNGTNFVGAEREMKAAVNEINRSMGAEKAAAMDIKWSFNPPVAPHFGGAWERLIQIIKKCLYAMPKARYPHKASAEELRSALIQAEFILNSRPLTHIPVESIDDEPLTPFHFLIGRAGEYVPPFSPTANTLSKEHYRRVQHYGKYFWDRWRKEYLPTILKRSKWTNKVEPIKVDDVVIITDKETPQGSWLKGRVTKINEAPDGQVRSAEIKTAQGIYTRAAAKIAVLDVRSKPAPEAAIKTRYINVHQVEPKPAPEDEIETHCINIHHEIIEKPVTSAREFHQRKRQATQFIRAEKAKHAYTGQRTITNNIKRKGAMEHPASIMTIPKMSRETQRAEDNLNSWGKRRKIDIEKVKELRDKMNMSRPAKKSTTSLKIHAPWYLTILMIMYFMAAAFGQQPSGLIAYDCANPDVNMTSYSLLDVKSCMPSVKNLSVTEVPIQVLQRNAKSTAMVYQCKMIIKRSIRHCGMHSHTSDYERGYSYIVKDFTPDECRRVHMTGAIPLTLNAGLHQLKRNQTTRGETLVIGSVWSSSCSGGVYKTPEYTWINALVYFEYEIALYNYMAVVDNENDQILLRHGLVCPYSHGKCLDSEDGYSTWDVSLNQRCEDTEFEVIYEGKVNKTINLDAQQDKQKAVYTSISDSHLFSIRTKDVAKICGYNGYNTDHPRIFIIETTEYKSPFARKPSGAKNHDIFTYFNSKITLVENYVGQRLDDVYNTVMTEMCKLDKALLETKLTLARINPTEFVNSIMKRSGFSAVVAGEVLHVLECKPVYVQPFASERCHQELPVKYGNVTMFLTPVTRTLQLRGTEIECTPLLPAKFQFGGRWYTFDGKIRETIPPQKLTTDIVTKWNYTPLPNLMESGIYDAESLKKMRTMIYDQGDRRIAANVMHKMLTGQNPSKQGFHFEALVSEKMIDNVINKYWDKLISWSSWLGNITSTAIGLYMIGRLFKFIIDTLMHGRILYDIYGFGWQLIASFWDSMTTFLTHRNTLRNIKRTTQKTYTVNKAENQEERIETTPLAENMKIQVITQPAPIPRIIIQQ